MREHAQKPRVRERHRRSLRTEFQVIHAGRQKGAADQIQPLLHLVLILEPRLAADTLGREKDIQVELIEFALHGDLPYRVRQLVGHEHHARKRDVWVVPLPFPLLLGPLFIRICPVVDLLLDELAGGDGPKRRAGEIEIAVGRNRHDLFVEVPDARALADYSCRLNVDETNPEKKVEEFISFLPVLAYDGSSMKQIDAAGILDMAMSGTTATLLARRWESALLVNVDNGTLKRLMDNEKAMTALMGIEGFRNLNQDIETIINKSEAVKKARKEANDKELSAKEKKELTEEEKKYKGLRKHIQEKLIKFATRVPIFMYLTDFRERSLKDVIAQLEPGLFKKVTGLTRDDFELLVSLGVFNSALMNDAVYKFKRYEDSSLIYTGIDRREGEGVGLYDTVLSRKDYQATFVNESAGA